MGKNLVRYLCKEHRFVHVSAGESHRPSKGLKDTQGPNMPFHSRMLEGFFSSFFSFLQRWESKRSVCVWTTSSARVSEGGVGGIQTTDLCRDVSGRLHERHLR